MQQAIEAEYGTFDDTVHEDILVDEAAMTDPLVVTHYSGVYSFETGAGLDFEWILYDVEEEDE
jgi:hypothetical protein